MSVWTYIQGTVRLSTPAIKEKLNKDGTYKLANEATQKKYFSKFERYIPYPNEQISLKYPEAILYSGDARPTIRYRMQVISYPIIKREVEKYIKDLPSGESNQIGYFLNYSEEDLNASTTCFECKDEEDYFKNYVLQNMDLWPGATYKEATQYHPHDLSWIEYNDGAILTLFDSIRSCESTELYNKLIEFFKNLVKNQINIEEGLIKFNQDKYYGGPSYEINIDNGNIEVIIREKEKEDIIERWQTFSTYYNNKYEFELKQVSEFRGYEDTVTDLRTWEKGE